MVRFFLWLFQWPLFLLGLAYAVWQEITWRGGR